MTAMKLAVAGAGGRMGRTLVRLIHQAGECEVAGAVEAKGSGHIGHDAGALAGIGDIGIKISDDPLTLSTMVDGFIDFTTPAATLNLAEICAQSRLVHVIGTTGIDEAGDKAIAAAGRHARIVKSGNMSLGVNLLARLVEQVAAALPGSFDIEICEMHHRHKVDAPSGTALMLGEAAARGRGVNLKETAIMARQGHTGPRPEGAIGFATLRGGTVVGEHSAIFAGADERVVLAHMAQSRDIFAHGAIKAAMWARDVKPGVYAMKDVLGI